MEKNGFTVDFKATTRLAIDGLTVQKTDDDSVLTAIYEPIKPPACLGCDCAGKPGSFLSTEYYDIYEDDLGSFRPEIVRIKLKRRRYQCPKCGNEIRSSLSFLSRGEKISSRVKTWIIQAALTRSYDEIAESLGNCVTPSHVRKIFNDWIDAQDREYEEKIAAPMELGIHHIVVGEKQYYALSNIEEKCLIDLFPCDDLNSFPQMLVHLSSKKRTALIHTDADLRCALYARAAFNQNDIVISHKSLLKSITLLLLQKFEIEYKGAEKATIRRVVSAPLTNDFVTQGERRTASTNLKTYSVLKDLFDAQIVLSIRIENGAWNQIEFSKWKKSIPWEPSTAPFLELLELCDAEITHSFSLSRKSDDFHEISGKIASEIACFPNCSFKVLRARLRYSKEPKQVTITTGSRVGGNGMRRYNRTAFYAGTPLD